MTKIIKKFLSMFLAIVCILSFLFGAGARNVAFASSNNYKLTFISSDMNNYPRVRLYFKITDSNGRVVNNYQIKSIELKEKLSGGRYLSREVKVSESLSDKYGLNTSMVIDKSGSISNADMQKIKQVVNTFAGSMKFEEIVWQNNLPVMLPGDKLEIIAFNDDVDLVCGYGRPLNQIIAEVNKIAPGGSTALYDGIYSGILHASNEGGARCVIAFTDGADNKSHYNSEDVINYAVKQQVPVYIIGVGSSVSESILKNMAQKTNGKYWHIKDLTDLSKIFMEIYSTEKSTYYIEYETDISGDQKYDIRNIELNITDGMYPIKFETSFIPVLPQKIGNDTTISLNKRLEMMKTINEYSVDTDIDQMDTISFGTYEQDGNINNGSEAIDWIVLDRDKSTGKVFLMSRIIIENHIFNSNGVDSLWQNSDIRKFINNDCYNAWFSESEKAKIVETKVATRDINNKDVYTNDKIYMLDENECRKFFGREDANQYNKRIATHITEFLKATRTNITVSNKNMWYKGNSSFWLRDAGSKSTYVKYVGLYGRLNKEGDSVSRNDGIRPVMWVSYR